MDRLEVIEVPGYTRGEKLSIAESFLVPKQLREHGLTPDLLDFTHEGLEAIVDHYTREAGVRSLEREIAAVCRDLAVRLAEGEDVEKQRRGRVGPAGHQGAARCASTTGSRFASQSSNVNFKGRSGSIVWRGSFSKAPTSKVVASLIGMPLWLRLKSRLFSQAVGQPPMASPDMTAPA
jgi:ATP-dependent Lon protease